MRRYIAILAIGFLVLAAPVAAKVVNVTNPMTANLDGGGHIVYNVHSYIGNEVAVTNQTGSVGVGLATLGTARGLVKLGDDGYPFFGYPSITAGTFDPSVTGADLDAGSLFLRRVDPTHGQLWFKTGPLSTDWSCIAGCAP